MAITRLELEKLFKINPQAELVKGPNLLYVNTGSDRLVFNVRANELSSLVAGFNYTNLNSLNSKQLTDLKKTSELKTRLDLRVVGRTKTIGPKEAPHPKLTAKTSRRDKVLTYPELTNTKINTIVNDFFTTYYNPSSGLKGKDLQKSFEAYAAKKRIPIDNKDLNSNKSIFKQVEKTYKGLSAHQRTLKAAQHGTKKILRADIKPVDSAYKTFAVTQKVIENDGKYLMFTDKNINAKEAAKIGTTMQQYFKVDKAIAVVTPTGVHTIIPRGNKVSVNGFNQPASAIGPTDALNAFNEIRNTRDRSTVASSEAFYARTQRRAEPEALEMLTKYAKYSVTGKSKSEAAKALSQTTVGDAKKVYKAMGRRSRDLEAYTMHDDTPLSKVLKDQNYKTVMLGANASYEPRLEARNKKTKQRISKLASRLGIDEGFLVEDLENIMYDGKSGLTEKGRLQQLNRETSTLTKMHNTLQQSADLALNDTRSLQSIRSIFKKDFKGPESTDIVKALRGGEKGMSWLQSRNLLNPTLDNPLLNLEGNIKRGYANDLAHSMFRDAMSGNEQPYNQKAVEALGGLLSQKDLNGFKKKFARQAQDYLPSPRDQVRLRQEIKAVYARDKNGNRVNNMALSKEAETYLDNKARINDVMYTLTDKFGGQDQISDTYKNIKSEGATRAKDLEIAAKHLMGKDFESSEIEVNQQKLDSLHFEDEKDRKAAYKELKENYSDADFDSAYRVEESATDRYKRVGADAFQQSDSDILGLKDKVAKYKARAAKGHLSDADLKDLTKTAAKYGYKGKAFDLNGMFSHLNDNYEAFFSETYPGMKNENGRVNVNLTKSLFSSIAKQSRDSAKRLGLEGLNLVDFKDQYKGTFSKDRPSNFSGFEKTPGFGTRRVNNFKPEGRNKATLKFMGQNKADWAHLLEAFHGDKAGYFKDGRWIETKGRRTIGNTSLVFGVPKESQNIKDTIISRLGATNYVDKKQLYQLQEIYGNNKIHTNRDENAFNILKRNMIDVDATADRPGHKALSAKVDAQALLDTLTAPYNLDPKVSAPGTTYFGKKMFREQNPEKYVEYFDPYTRKMHKDGKLTKAQKNQAFVYLDNIGQLDNFQAHGMQDIIPQKDLHALVSQTEAYSRQFVDRQIGLFSGDDPKSREARQKIKDRLRSKIYDIGIVAGKAHDGGQGQTASAYIEALKDLKSTFRGEVNKTNQGFAHEIVANPEKALNSKVTSKARSHLGDAALREAKRYGAELITSHEELSLVQKSHEANTANATKAELLKYNDIGYSPSKSIDSFEDFVKTLNSNKDPLLQAEQKAGEAIKKSQEKSALRKSRVYKDWVEKRSGEAHKAKIRPYESFDDFALAPTADKKKGENLRYNQQHQLGREWSFKPGDAVTLNKKAQLNKIKKLQESRKLFEARYKWLGDGAWFKEHLQKGKAVFPRRFSKGGKVPGKGTIDNVPALLTKGEVVLDTKTSADLGIHTQKDYERFKGAVKEGRVSKFAEGGLVGDIFSDINKYKEFENKLMFDIRDNSKPTYNYNFAGSDKASKQAQAFRYKQDMSGVTPNTHAYYDRTGTEGARVRKNVVIDLAANNATVNLGMGDQEIQDTFKTVADNYDMHKVSPTQLKQARDNFATQKLTKAIDLLPKEIAQIREAQNPLYKGNIADLPGELIEKVQAMDSKTLDANLGSVKGLEGVADIRAGIKKIVQIKPDSIGKLSSFQKATIAVERHAEVLGQTFGKSSKLFGNMSKMSPESIATALTSAFDGYDWEKTNLDTNGKTSMELRRQQQGLTAVKDVLKHDVFSQEKYKNSEALKAGVSATGDHVGAARSLREHAKARVGEFSSLMMQNAAFGMSYAILGGIQQGVGSTIGFVAQFDDAMKNLQAITGDTSDGLNVMSTAVKQVSTETKFSALEISEAATILGQAGFSAIDIGKSLDGVVQLATATGSGLEDATQVLTSTLTIWDKSLADSKKYASEFTAAINESKLDITSLTGAIQYSGNIAASAGIPSTDVLTLTSLLKDAGIKRPSTLGTGQRLLFGDIASPSKKFAQSLRSVGIELQDFQAAFDSKGIYGALKLMKDAGYGLAQASKGMEVREKAIYAAAINQLDKFEGFRESITGTSAAYIANKTQMEGLGNSFKNMLNSWQINMNESLENSKGPLGAIVDGLTIDIAKKDPSHLLGVKGYTMEQRETPQASGGYGMASVGAAVTAGYLAKFAPGLIQDSAIKITEQLSKTNYAGGKTAGTLGFLSKQVLNLSKAIGGISPGVKLAGGVGAASAGLGALFAPDGSKGAAFTDGVVNLAALYVADKALDKAASTRAMKEALGGKRFGLTSKLGAGIGLSLLDSGLIAPEREKGSALGYGGTMAEGGAMGAYLGSRFGPKGIAIGGALGAAAGAALTKLSEVTAPTIGVGSALAQLTNDAKAVSSEFDSLHKAAISLEDLSNFAMRASDDAEEKEKISKFRLAVDDANKKNDEVKGIEAILKSYSEDFAGFNFGDVLATTPEKGKPGEASIENGIFNIQEFEADGVSISSKTVQFKGKAADALATMYRSAEVASRLAKAAPGGSDEQAFAQMAGKGTADLLEKFVNAKDTEDASAIQEQFNRSVFDFVKNAPETSLSKIEDLEKLIIGTGEVRKQALIDNKNDETPWYKFSLADDNKAQLATADDRALVDVQTKKDVAQLYRKAEVAATYAKSASAVMGIAVDQVAIERKKLVKENAAAGISTAVTMQQAFDSWRTSPSGKTTIEKYRNLQLDESGTRGLLDKLSDGKTKLDAINVAALDVTRDLSVKAADALTKQVVKMGPAITSMALALSKDLNPTVKALAKSFRETNTKYGIDQKGVNSAELIEDRPELNIINERRFNNTVKGKYGLTDRDNTVDVRDNVSIYRDNTKAIQDSSKIITKQYMLQKKRSAKFTNDTFSFGSLEELVAAGGGIDQVKLFENLTRQLDKIGITKAGFDAARATGPISLDALRASGQDLESYLTPEKKQQLANQKQYAIEKLDVQKVHAKEMALENFKFQAGEIIIGGDQARAKASRQLGYGQDKAILNLTRNLTDIQTTKNRNIENAEINFVRQISKFQTNQDNVIRDIYRNKDRGLRDQETKEFRAYQDLSTKVLQAREDNDLNTQRAEDDIATKAERGLRDISTNFERGMRDIAINTSRSFEDLAIKQSRGLRDIAINTSRAFEDLAVQGQRAYQDLAISARRGQEDLEIRAERGFQDIEIRRIRGEEDISLKYTRGLENIAIASVRGIEDIALSTARNTEKAYLTETRSLEDLYKKVARAEQDLISDKEDSLNDLELKRDRSIEDALLNYSDNLAAINRNFQRNVEALERSRQDTINAFERSLDRPAVVTLNAEALTTVADNLGNVELALDANKAALTANTTAVKQAIALQKSQENIVAEAYKDAYKKVGGEVYNEDGSVNDSFTQAYDDYMASNSESLVDTVLMNALNSAFSGVDFDITSALGDASYIAGAVSTPTPGLAMDSAVLGSGLTVDELVAALYDVKSGEVRVTSTSGVILEAQGEMQGALFDLETAFINIDIQIREAGFALAASIEEAGISLANNLRDIEIQYQRSLLDLETGFERALDDVSSMLSRGLEDIALNTSRNLQDIAIAFKYATEDLEKSLTRAGEDLALSIERAGEDLDIGLRRAGEDLALSISRGAEDLARNLQRGAEDIALSLARGAEDIARNSQRAMEDLARSIQDGVEDINLANARAIEDLERARTDQLADLGTGIADSLLDVEEAHKRMTTDIETSATRTTEQIALAGERFREDVEIKATDAIVDAGYQFHDQVVQSQTNLAETMENIAKGTREANADAWLTFDRALESLKINYTQQLAEIDVSIQEALGKLARGYTEGMRVLDANYDFAIQNLNTEFDTAIEKLFTSTSTWATQMVDTVNAGLTTKVWDSAGWFTSLETQIGQRLSKLEIDANLVLQGVVSMFKAALSGEAVKKAGALLGADVAGLLSEAFTDVTIPVKTTIDAINESIEKDSIAKLAETLKVVPTTINEVTKNSKAATDALIAALEPWPNINKDIATTGENLGKSTESIKSTADSAVTISGQAATATASAAISYSSIKAATADMAEAARQYATASMNVANAAHGAVTYISALGYIPYTLDYMAQSIAQAAQRAINTINAAVASAKSTGYRTGGLVPGYGGGDIFPAMLEPGEVILRKEVVKEFGAERFLALNENAGGEMSVATPQVVGLPSGQGQGISVQMNVQAGTSIDLLEQNMERIADGVKKVFEEYS